LVGNLREKAEDLELSLVEGLRLDRRMHQANPNHQGSPAKLLKFGRKLGELRVE
jgi:hypothetical protein